MLTTPVRWRPFRKLDRPLATVLRLEPRLLSSRVVVARVPFQGSATQRIQHWLWERHTIYTGMTLASGIGFAIFVLGFAVSAFVSDRPQGSECAADTASAPNMDTAAYLGGLFGFLQAVTIFAVQLRSQRDSSMLSLTPLIARRYFAFLILGFIAGVAIANLLAVLAAPVLSVGRTTFAILGWFNLFAVPLSTLAAFWYLAKIVSEAGQGDMDVAIPVLRATMRQQALDDARKAAMLNEYENCLEAAGIRYDRFGAAIARGDRISAVQLPFGPSGDIYEVDCHRLNEVGRLLGAIRPLPQAVISVAVGEACSGESALILTWESAAAGETGLHVQSPISAEQQRRLCTVLKNVFLTTSEGAA